MILYLDSSSVVSWHLEEEGRHEGIREAVDTADFIASAILTYVEVRAAFARALRGGRVDAGRHDRLRVDFDDDWRSYLKVAPTARIVRLAGDLAERHALRAYDSVHLGSAIILRDRVPDTISFSTWDRRLAQAAAAEGLQGAH